MISNNKVILVTGASKGIGLAISSKLKYQGYTVLGIARNSVENFPGILYLCDLTDEIATQQILEKIANDYSIDGIVNNVGISLPQPIESVDLNTTRQVLALNLLSAIQIMQFLPIPLKRKNGEE